MAGVLTTDEIDEFRDLVEELAMPDIYAVRRDVAVEDDSGGIVMTPTTVSVGPCRLRSISGGGEQVTADRLGWKVAYAIDLPMTTTVTPSDQLLIDGRTFSIGAITDIGAWALSQTVIAREQG